MDRVELEHAIRAAGEVADDHELWVFGSQAILGQYPDAPADLRQSIEVDIQPRNRVEMTDAIDGSLGEDSAFHRTHKFYVHGVAIESAILPAGWQERTVAIRERVIGKTTGFCLEAHDLAASKLAAGRDKDRSYVRVLLREGMIEPEELALRIQELPIAPESMVRLEKWVDATASELDGGS